MSPPMVSLCIPVYAPRAHHLERLLGSIRDQVYPAIEVIITDDGSSVDLDALVAEASLDAVSVRRNPRRLGMIANWNHAAGQATGALMMVLGQDDELGADLVGRYVDEFARDTAVVACSSGEVWIDDEGREIDVPRRPNRRENIFLAQPRYRLTQGDLVRLCLRNGQVYGEPSAVMFRRSAFESVGGYRADMGHIADLDLDLRLAGVGPVVYLADPLVRRRLHGHMATVGQQAGGETAEARERLHCAWIDHPALSDRDRSRARVALASWAARDVVKAVARRRWAVARNQAGVVRRYGRNPARYVVENVAELVSGRNRDAR